MPVQFVMTALPQIYPTPLHPTSTNPNRIPTPPLYSAFEFFSASFFAALFLGAMMNLLTANSQNK